MVYPTLKVGWFTRVVSGATIVSPFIARVLPPIYNSWDEKQVGFDPCLAQKQWVEVRK